VCHWKDVFPSIQEVLVGGGVCWWQASMGVINSGQRLLDRTWRFLMKEVLGESSG